MGKRALIKVSLFLLILSAFLPCLAQEKSVPFSIGEKIRYSILAEGIKIGNQTMEVSSLTKRDGADVYVIKGQSTTSTLLSIIYRLDDRWDVFMDKETLYPIRVEKDWAEGKDEGYYVYDIDQAGRIVQHNDMTSGKVKTLTPKNTVFDLFSLIYYYRVNAETLANPFVFDFLETKGVRTVRFEDQGEMEISIFKISPHNPVRVRKLKQIGGVGIEIYIGTDALRLPLKLLTPAKLSRKKTVNIEFIIDGFSPGIEQETIPREYRRLRY